MYASIFSPAFKMDQPRVPSGGPHGGEFASSGGGSRVGGGSGMGGSTMGGSTMGGVSELRGGGSVASYADHFDDPNVTQGTILAKLPPPERQEISDLLGKSNHFVSSQEQFNVKDGPRKGQYTPERAALHKEIIDSFLSKAAIEAATPAKGEKPTFVLLGGRGGSGKSAFTNGTLHEFDAKKFILMDSDAIKGKLRPPYEGWNAFAVHEESSDVFEQLTQRAKSMGLNIIHDVTLKGSSALKNVAEFKDAGYRVEGNYMFLPRQEAASRAVSRFLGKGPGARGRLVPPEVILSNVNNEKNFDALKPYFDKWSAYDNRGKAPTLIARK